MRESLGSTFPPEFTRLVWYVYERQSTPGQVQQNDGSVAYQRSMRDLLIERGVPPAQVIELGRDLGKSGQGMGYRDDYKFLLEEVQNGKPVGVAAASIWRLGRRAIDIFKVLEACQIHGAPLFLAVRLYDATDLDELMTMELTAIVGQRSNDQHHKWMSNCRIAKAREGKIVGACPTGIIKGTEDGPKKGFPARDPDPLIQEAINAVFREFRKHGNCRRTARVLKQQRKKLPVRKGNVVLWKDATTWSVNRIIRNALFAGRYVFRKTVVDRRLGLDNKGHWRIRRSEPSEQEIGRGIFEGYISWEEYLQNQERLRTNGGRRTGRRSTKAAPAIGQGLVRCRMHPKNLMTPKALMPRKDGSWLLSYQCPGTSHDHGPYCISPNAVYVDRLLRQAVADKIAAPPLELIKKAYDEARGDERAERFRVKVELLRAQEREAKLEQLYLSEDATNKFARQALGKRWDEAIKERINLQARFDCTEVAPSVFDDDARFKEFRELCTDKDRLLGLATPIELNDIAGILTEVIWVEEYSPERLELRIVWREGGADSVVETKLWGWAYRRILERTAQGASAPEIAEELNAEGVLTRNLRRWTQRLVLAVLERLRNGDNRVGDWRVDSQEGPIS